MTKLHELLAVEQGLGETANRITKDTVRNLSGRAAIFKGMTKTHTMFAEESQHMVQAQENLEVQSTVDEQLSFLNNNLAAYWDVSLQKEAANQSAVADIIIDGTVISSNVPSITLLGLEKKLTSLLAVYNAIPTLDAAVAWEIDPNYAKPGVFRTKYATERQQSATTRDFKEISPATQHHKAQIAEVEKTEVVGKYTITDFSGAVPSVVKAEKLAKLTILIQAVKQARQRANGTEVDTSRTIGADLLNFIND